MNSLPNVRVYVNTPAQASAAIEAINDCLDPKGKVRFERLISFDTESMPKEGLEGYPTTLSGALDVSVTKTHYMKWLFWTMMRDFDIEKLEEIGCRVPEKFNGRNYFRLWEHFAEQVKLNKDKVQAAMKPESKLNFIIWLHAIDQVIQDRGPSKDPIQPGLQPYDTDIFVLQFSLRELSGRKHSWVINCAKVDIKKFVPIFQRKDVTYIAFNAKFDLSHLIHNLGRKVAPKKIYDPMVADKLLSLGMRMDRDLGSVAKRTLGIDVSKEVRSSFIGRRVDELTPEQIDYSFIDTEILLDLYDAQYKEAIAKKQWQLLDLFSRLSWITAVWETQGFDIDVSLWIELAQQAASKRDEYARKLELMLTGQSYEGPQEIDEEELAKGDDDKDDVDEDGDEDDKAVDPRKYFTIKLSSRDLVSGLAANLLGLTPAELLQRNKKLVGKNGLMSLGKDKRTQIENYYISKHGQTHEFFDYYAKWSAYSKMASTYGHRFLWLIHPISGKIHPIFRIAGTDTGRYASTRPNFLNLPRGDIGIDVRSAVKAPKGYWIGGADFSAFEMRAAAALSKDPAMMKIFEKKIDIHTGAAILAFHIETGKVTEPTLVTKPFRIGAQYFENRQVWVLPESWTPDQRLDFALSEQGMSALLKVQKFNKDGTPKMENGKPVFEKPTRQLAKTVNFLIIYGGHAYTLASKTNITVDEAQAIIDTYYAAFPELKKVADEWGQKPFQPQYQKEFKLYRKDGTSYFLRAGYVEGRGSLRRYFMMPIQPSRSKFPNDAQGDSDFLEAKKEWSGKRNSITRQGFNLGAQGGNAVVTADALLDVVDKGEPFDILPWISVYDEIKVLVPDSLCVEKEVDGQTIPWCQEYVDIIGPSMVNSAQLYFPEVQFEADADPLARIWKKF